MVPLHETQYLDSVFGVVFGNIAVPVNFAIVGKLAQTVFPGVTSAIPFETKLQCCKIGKWSCVISFLLGATVIGPLVRTIPSLGFRCSSENIAVPWILR
jgi:hypothetical protein